ncbi:MAG: PAS domain S-box protein [Candidatus Omnitrophica bacterium]|nr:PAS domain S-box protein [Candidatus Omnitrophota bacterium]
MKVSIGHKIFLGFFIIILLSASFFIISNPLLLEIENLSSLVVPLSHEIDTLRKYNEKINQAQSKIELFLSVRSEESREEAEAVLRQINQLVANIKYSQDLSQLNEISDIILELTRSGYILLGYAESSESTYDINLQIIKVNDLFKRFQEAQQKLQQKSLKSLQANVNAQKDKINVSLDRLLWIEISIGVVGFFASLFLSKLITRNIYKLQKGTKEIAAGNFDTRIDIKSKDEIGQLADSFNSMAEDLQKKTVSKEYVDNIIASMAETLIIIDSNLRIIGVNRSLCQLLGYSEKELIGESIKKICCTYNSSFNLADMQDHILKGDLKNFEVNYLCSDTRTIPMLLSLSLMKDKTGQTKYIICTARDITERKVVEEKIKEVAEMKSKLTSMVSHELRTPMAAIKTGISIVLDGLAGEINEEQRDILDTSRRNVDRLARLINDVLDFQKLESGKVEFNFLENNINEAVREVHKAMASVAAKKNLQLILELDESIAPAVFDRDKILQVLSNLVNNAIKFTKEGRIAITTRQLNNELRVEVADTGIGIKYEDLPRTFSSFEQIQRPAGGEEAGSGLGLAISKEIIEAHGGRIWVESELGIGSTFYFALPLSA